MEGRLRNPVTDAIENLEVLFFATRLLRQELMDLPVTADLRLSGESPRQHSPS